MYVSVEKCATSDIRCKLRELGLSSSKTRSESIQLLKEHNVFVIDVEVHPSVRQRTNTRHTPVVTTQTPSPPQPTDEQRNLFEHVNVFDVTPQQFSTTDRQSLLQSASTTTDAVFSHASIRNLRVGGSLNVDGYNIVNEIERIKRLRFLLLQDFESIRVSFDNMRMVFQNTINQDLPMYNIAHDVAHNSFETTITGFQDTNPIVSSPSFYGKIEDTTLNIDMNFVLDFDPTASNRTDRFSIQLPHALDTSVLSIVPVMVTVYFDHDSETQQYRQVSSISHGYIDRDSPDRVIVYANVLKDSRFTKYQFDVACRYLCTVDAHTISPVRYGSLHKDTFESENGNVSHQWSDVDNRVDLFTNLDVSNVSTSSDTINVRLPVPMIESAIRNVVGFGTVHYTTNIPALNTTTFTTNTPLVYISETEPSVLVVKSSLFKGFRSTNNIQSMKLAVHVSYQKGVSDDYVFNTRLSTSRDRVFWNTKAPINPIYFDEIKVNGVDVLNTLVGSQTTWSVSTLGADSISSLCIKIRNIDYVYDKAVN